VLDGNVSIDEAKLFDQYQNLFEFVRKEHQPNVIYCKMMEHERWAKYFATCNTLECLSELIKIAQFHFSVWLITLMWNDFFLDAATNLKEREIIVFEPVFTLLRLVCNLKHLSCN